MSDAETSLDRTRRRRRDELRDLGQRVAAALGAGWSYMEPPDDLDHVAYLTDAHGRHVVLCWHFNEARKVAVSGGYRRHDRLGSGPREQPRVNVGVDRAPDALARDLSRRFLPAFYAAWDQWESECAGYDARDGRAAALAAEIGAALRASPRLFHGDHDVGFYRDGLSVTFAVSAFGHTRLEVRGMSDELARRLAAAIADEVLS